jgi:hypothetical protein
MALDRNRFANPPTVHASRKFDQRGSLGHVNPELMDPGGCTEAKAMARKGTIEAAEAKIRMTAVNALLSLFNCHGFL